MAVDLCPNCRSALRHTRTPYGYVHVCADCGGRSVTLPVLRRFGAARAWLNDLWQGSQEPGLKRQRRCPHCATRMREVRTRADGQPLTVEVCRPCMAIWFDPSEFEAVPAPESPERPVEDRMSPEARQKLAILQVKKMQELADEEEEPMQPRHLLHAVLGIPAEMNEPARSGRPWMIWGVIAACSVYTALMLSTAAGVPGGPFRKWGFVPAQWDRMGGLTIISAFFLHGGWFHLLGNMGFLWVFGNNVEDRLGWARLAVLMGLAHVIGLVVHATFTPNPNVPCVGASAGISGVVAFYAVIYPNVRLGIPMRYGMHVHWVRMPAATALGFYALLQIVGSWWQVSGFGGVSYLAHLGGLAVGLAAALRYRIQQTRRRGEALA